MLAFDHRTSFAREVCGDQEATGEAAVRVAEAKMTVFEGLASAAGGSADPRERGVLVDEQYGKAVARRARGLGLTVAVPVERSGRRVFEFEYGDRFADHIEAMDPDMAKVLVRLNPLGDPDDNAVQLERLRRLGDHLREVGRLFLFELLVPPTDAQLQAVGGDRLAYEFEHRPASIVGAIEMIRDAGIEPDLWKLEGVDREADARRVLGAVRDGSDRAEVGCLVLGAGAADERVGAWLDAAAAAGYSGFAIGRSIWREPLRRHLGGELSREEVAVEVADRFDRFARRFLAAAPDGGSA